MKKTNSITIKLSTVFISILLLSFVIIMSYNYYKSSLHSYAYINKVTDELALKTISRTSAYLNDANTPLRVISSITPSEIFSNYENTLSVMNEYIHTNKHLASIFIGDKNGNFFQVRREPAFALRIIKKQDDVFMDTWTYDNNKIVKKLATYDARTRTWYKDAKKNKISISEPYLFSSTGKLGITVYYAFYENEKKSYVVASDISLSSLSSFIKNEAKSIGGVISLISSIGDIIVSSEDVINKNSLLKNINKLDFNNVTIQSAKAYLNGNKTGRFKDKEGDTYVYIGKNFNPSENLSWNIVISVPEGKILEGVNNTFFETLIISFIILILFLLIALKISQGLSKPIIRLSEDIKNLEQLDLDILIDNSSTITEINTAQNSLISLRLGLKSFSKYMPSDLVKILIKSKKEIKIGGSEKNLAIMFTDIESFTTISEKLLTKDLTQYLSEYFDVMEKVISSHEGTIDKYIGDAVMAFWGAPLDIEDPIEKAVRSSLILQEKLLVFNDELFKKVGVRFNTRIGVHYGKTLVGNIGSNDRMNYTIIGDNVNIAARLENINKVYKTKIIISNEVYEKISSKFDIVYLDELALKGKSISTKIYEVKGLL